MKKLSQRLYNYFIPSRLMADEEVFRKARIFVNTVIITFLFALFYVGNNIMFEMPHVAVQIGTYSLLFLSLVFLLKIGVSMPVCGNLFTLLFYTSNLYEIYWCGGLYSGTLPWLAVVPVIAILITTLRSALIWMIICVVTAITVGVLHHNGFPFKLEINPDYVHTLLITSHSGLIVIIFVVSYVMENAYIRSLNVLDEKNKAIEQERKKSEELLLNILPSEVMDELKQTGRTTAKSYDLVTVMFADFKDFTLIAEKLPPEELVTAIDEYFTGFDSIVDNHHVEKIKTVGDAYLCAGGLPVPNTKNPVQVVETAFDFLRMVDELSKKRKAEGKFCFTLRIGIHSGPLVAGVVGSKKFEYDIWGDAVNTAARMQQNGEENKINISGTTYELIKHRYNCTHRGRIETKNKGLVDMYFVENKK
ncbi:MAG: adenylate/guanylate cyclase domain-containing protein [Chitinophagales bacterium]